MLRNSKSPIISPEEVSTEGYYTFNLNPQKQSEYEGSPIARWNKVYKDIQQLISQFIESAEIEGYLEISRTGRIHMHGWIKFKNIANFYLELPKVLKLATIEIDTIQDPHKWYDYCTKCNNVLKAYQTHIKQDRFANTKLSFLDGI